MTDTVETDYVYAISEIQDIQAELELHSLSDLSSRLEGVEVRLKEVTDALLEYASLVPYGTTHAANGLTNALQG